MGSDGRWTTSSAPSSAFQFTLPHGERPGRRSRPRPPSPFQFTLPHGERQGGRHARPHHGSFNSRSRMGSDQSSAPSQEDMMVSIHAPAWGATRLLVPPLRPIMFQFTLPHGERPATGTVSGSSLKFQFTLPHGERRPCRGGRRREYGFQFTLPHGERLGVAVGLDGLGGFNSRSRMGSDLFVLCAVIGAEVSIHAPAWGATFSSFVR